MARYRIKFSEIEDYTKEDWITVVDAICRYANSNLTYMGPEDILAMLGIDRVEEAEKKEELPFESVVNCDA